MADVTKGKSKVKAFTPNIGDFEWEGKKYHNHMVVFEDGVAGKCVTTTADGSPWKEGEEVEYELSKDKQGNNKIRRVQQQSGGGRYGGRGNYVPEDISLKTASIVLGYAKDLAMDKIIPIADVIPKSEEYYAWVMSKQTKKEE